MENAIPTIKTHQPFDALEDSKVLRSAMKGLGTDEDRIIKILTKRTSKQRREIAAAFHGEFGRDLIQDLRSELGGRLEQVISALMSDPDEYLASEIHVAMDGMGTKEKVLTEILCTRNDRQIQMISDAYSKLYGKDLAADVTSELSGDYKRLLILLLTEKRRQENVNVAEVASRLYKAGEGRLGTDEDAIIHSLVECSFSDLKLIFAEYEKLSGKTFFQALESEVSGNFKEACLAIAHCATCLPRYFAEKLHQATEGLGTCDRTLIRIIVSRSELDLASIKAEYQKLYQKTMESRIQSDTSGDYRNVVLSIIQGN